MTKTVDTTLEKRQEWLYCLVLLGARINGNEFVAYEHESALAVIKSNTRLDLLDKHTPEFRKKLSEAAYNASFGLKNKANESIIRDLEIIAKQAEYHNEVEKFANTVK